jgi:hypothetical protein
LVPEVFMNPFSFTPEEVEFLRFLVLVSSVIFLLLPFILFVAGAVKRTAQGRAIGTWASLFCAVVSLALFMMVWGVWLFAGPWSEGVVFTYIVALMVNGCVMIVVPKLRFGVKKPETPPSESRHPRLRAL